MIMDMSVFGMSFFFVCRTVIVLLLLLLSVVCMLTCMSCMHMTICIL